jgi:hypothetical protein
MGALLLIYSEVSHRGFQSVLAGVIGTLSAITAIVVWFNEKPNTPPK